MCVCFFVLCVCVCLFGGLKLCCVASCLVVFVCLFVFFVLFKYFYVGFCDVDVFFLNDCFLFLFF